MIKPTIPIIFLSLFTSCYYDNEETLYPTKGGCDTTNITYTNTIKSIVDINCVGCHNAGNALGGVDLSTYSLVRLSGENGSLYGTTDRKSVV